jgi:two-component system, sporulation sensor kinase E
MEMKKSTEKLSNIKSHHTNPLTENERPVQDVHHPVEHRVNILMVDDHPENLLALEAVLGGSDYNLISALSGEEALKLLLKYDFAVILLDVQMPGMNGFETAQFIKTREKSKDIPIIFITAISQAAEHVLHGYSVGAIDYIFKPFQPETLKSKIEGFVKLYQNRERIQLQNKLLKQRTAELEEANRKLKETTASLRKTEALARLIGDTSLDTVVMFNEAGNILTLNPASIDMFHYKSEELVERNITSLLPEVWCESKEREQSSISAPVKPRIGELTETEAVRKNGMRFPVEIQIGKADLDDQHIFICSIRDISLRKQIEEDRKTQYDQLERLVQERTQELLSANEKLQQESNERQKIAEKLRESNQEIERILDSFKKVFESSPCLIEIRSLKDNRYVDVNESWLNLTGYNYDDIKTNTEDILHLTFEPEENHVENIDTRTPGTNQNVKISYVTKNGDKREGLLSAKTIEFQEEACVLSVITDITEMQNLEKELARLDRLNLIGEMAAGIAHEIRNPMTTVRGFLQLLKKNPSPIYIDLMVEELDRANTIITEYLTLAKNKKTDRKLRNLNSIIHTLFPLIQAEATLTNKYIQLELEECPPLRLDEKEIRQLILNLALNGLEAMTAGGKLTIRTSTDTKNVVLEIRDEGCGIKDDLLKKIGTPFFTTKEHGTGLGLAVCYSVAERHHAEIDIETGQTGTIFYVRFRIDQKVKKHLIIAK